jgi:hypothetical protein
MGCDLRILPLKGVELDNLGVNGITLTRRVRGGKGSAGSQQAYIGVSVQFQRESESPAEAGSKRCGFLL